MSHITKHIQQCVGEQKYPEMSFTIGIREDREEGGYIAECLDMPGCVSEGDTRDEALANISDAISSCLDVIVEDCLREVMLSRRLNTSYVGISEQHTVKIRSKEWELQTV